MLLKHSVEFCISLKQSATCCKQKTEEFLVTRPSTCWKLSMKWQKRDESELVTKLVGIVVMIIFVTKSFSNSL